MKNYDFWGKVFLMNFRRKISLTIERNIIKKNSPKCVSSRKIIREKYFKKNHLKFVLYTLFDQTSSGPRSPTVLKNTHPRQTDVMKFITHLTIFEIFLVCGAVYNN